MNSLCWKPKGVERPKKYWKTPNCPSFWIPPSRRAPSIIIIALFSHLHHSVFHLLSCISLSHWIVLHCNARSSRIRRGRRSFWVWGGIWSYRPVHLGKRQSFRSDRHSYCLPPSCIDIQICETTCKRTSLPSHNQVISFRKERWWSETTGTERFEKQGERRASENWSEIVEEYYHERYVCPVRMVENKLKLKFFKLYKQTLAEFGILETLSIPLWSLSSMRFQWSSWPKSRLILLYVYWRFLAFSSETDLILWIAYKKGHRLVIWDIFITGLSPFPWTMPWTAGSAQNDWLEKDVQSANIPVPIYKWHSSIFIHRKQRKMLQSASCKLLTVWRPDTSNWKKKRSRRA